MTTPKTNFTEQQKQAILEVMKFSSKLQWGEFDEFEINRYDNNIVPEVYGQNMQIQEYPLTLIGICLALEDMDKTVDWLNDYEQSN